MMNKPLKRRLSKREVAEILGFKSTDTVDRRVKSGQLEPGERDGGRMFWTDQKVRKYRVRQTA